MSWVLFVQVVFIIFLIAIVVLMAFAMVIQRMVEAKIEIHDVLGCPCKK